MPNGRPLTPETESLLARRLRRREAPVSRTEAGLGGALRFLGRRLVTSPAAERAQLSREADIRESERQALPVEPALLGQIKDLDVELRLQENPQLSEEDARKQADVDLEGLTVGDIGSVADFQRIRALIATGTIRARARREAAGAREETLGEVRSRLIKESQSAGLQRAIRVTGVRTQEELSPAIITAFERIEAIDRARRLGAKNPFPLTGDFLSSVGEISRTDPQRAARLIDAAVADPARTRRQFGDEFDDAIKVFVGLQDPSLRRFAFFDILGRRPEQVVP